jgi:predicted GTPase
MTSLVPPYDNKNDGDIVDKNMLSAFQMDEDKNSAIKLKEKSSVVTNPPNKSIKNVKDVSSQVVNLLDDSDVVSVGCMGECKGDRRDLNNKKELLTKWIIDTIILDDSFTQSLLAGNNITSDNRNDKIIKAIMSSFDSLDPIIYNGLDLNDVKYKMEKLFEGPLRSSILDALNKAIKQVIKALIDKSKTTHHILIFGPTGTGKSTIILILASILNFINPGEYTPIIRVDSHSQGTSEVSPPIAISILGSKFCFWDVPGTGDPDKEKLCDNDIIQQIIKKIGKSTIDAILLVSSAATPRFTEMERNSINSIIKAFEKEGYKLWKKVILVLNKCNHFRSSEEAPIYDEDDVDGWEEEMIEYMDDYSKELHKRLQIKKDKWKKYILTISKDNYTNYYIGRKIKIKRGTKGKEYYIGKIINYKSEDNIYRVILDSHPDFGNNERGHPLRPKMWIDKDNIIIDTRLSPNIDTIMSDIIENIPIVPIGYVKKKDNQNKVDICSCGHKYNPDNKTYKDCCRSSDYNNCSILPFPSFTHLIPRSIIQMENSNISSKAKKLIIDKHWVGTLYNTILKVGSNDLTLKVGFYNYLQIDKSNNKTIKGIYFDKDVSDKVTNAFKKKWEENKVECTAKLELNWFQKFWYWVFGW